MLNPALPLNESKDAPGDEFTPIGMVIRSGAELVEIDMDVTLVSLFDTNARRTLCSASIQSSYKYRAFLE